MMTVDDARTLNMLNRPLWAPICGSRVNPLSYMYMY